MKFDQLRVASYRLNAYRGLASEAYISLSSDDPFLTAFQLAKELRKLSDVEEHFKVFLILLLFNFVLLFGQINVIYCECEREKRSKRKNERENIPERSKGKKKKF